MHVQVGAQCMDLVVGFLQLAHEISNTGLRRVQVVLQVLALFWVCRRTELCLVIALALAQLALIGLDAEDFQLHVIDGELGGAGGVDKPGVCGLCLLVLLLFWDGGRSTERLCALQGGQLEQGLLQVL